MPVQGASRNDYNQKSFWYYPWGRSGTRKGVDVLARRETNLNASFDGLMLYTGVIETGDHVVVILSSKWRLHDYAHLDDMTTSVAWVTRKRLIGNVGNSGIAQGKQPHL